VVPTQDGCSLTLVAIENDGRQRDSTLELGDEFVDMLGIDRIAETGLVPDSVRCIGIKFAQRQGRMKVVSNPQAFQCGFVEIAGSCCLLE
jgi:hypothetical protein